MGGRREEQKRAEAGGRGGWKEVLEHQGYIYFRPFGYPTGSGRLIYIVPICDSKDMGACNVVCEAK